MTGPHERPAAVGAPEPAGVHPGTRLGLPRPDAVDEPARAAGSAGARVGDVDAGISRPYRLAG